MKAIMLAAAIIAATASLAAAEQPGKDWVSKDQVMATLKQAGFTDVKDPKAESGRWQTEAAIDGKTWDVMVDPQSGRISKVEKGK